MANSIPKIPGVIPGLSRVFDAFEPDELQKRESDGTRGRQGGMPGGLGEQGLWQVCDLGDEY